jgi:peptidoglycan/xylan/chitin deacetylase (PgdA/CDA1 family)
MADEADSTLSRRTILQSGTAAAGAAALTTTGVAAQQLAQVVTPTPAPAPANRPIRQGEPHPFYDYSAMPKRPRLTWPNGARLAVHLVSNIEHWDVHDNNGRMDVRNLPRNDYGLRVAVWRLFDIFSERRITHTIALNSAVCKFYPEIIDAAKARGDEFMGHGITNVERLDSVSPANAAEIIRVTVNTIQTSTGQRVRGWLGPGLQEGEGTLDALKANGIEYVCDWGTADDQPFMMRNGLYVVPYTVDLNDIGLINQQGTPASTFADYIVDAFDTLYREGETQARVLPIALHPFLIGAPHRVPHLVRAIDHIRSHGRVWFASGGEILDAYRQAMATLGRAP